MGKSAARVVKAVCLRCASSAAAAAAALVAPPAAADMRFLLLRHGETNYNKEGRIQGTLDASRLTPRGHEQARAVGRFLSEAASAAAAAGGTAAASEGEDRGIGLALCDTVVVSPMSRARQTLSEVQEELKRVGREPLREFVVPEVREIQLWEWEGMLKAELETHEEHRGLYRQWKDSPIDVRLSGGRSPLHELWARAARAWDIIRLEPAFATAAAAAAAEGEAEGGEGSGAKEVTVLVVAHNAVNQALLATALGLGEDHFRSVIWPNCGIVEVRWPRFFEDPKSHAESYRWLYPEASGRPVAASVAALEREFLEQPVIK